MASANPLRSASPLSPAAMDARHAATAPSIVVNAISDAMTILSHAERARLPPGSAVGVERCSVQLFPSQYRQASGSSGSGYHPAAAPPASVKPHLLRRAST